MANPLDLMAFLNAKKTGVNPLDMMAARKPAAVDMLSMQDESSPYEPVPGVLPETVQVQNEEAAAADGDPNLQVLRQLAMASAPTQKSPEEIAAQQALQDTFQKRQAQQEGSISSMEDSLKKYLARERKTDLSPLLALADSWSGSNLLKAYNRPETQEERDAKVLQIQNLIAKQRGELTDNELSLLKSRASELASDRRNSDYYKNVRALAGMQFKEDEALESKVKDLSKRTELFPSIKEAIQTVEGLIPENGKIPGIGVGQAKLPMFALPETGRKLRQSLIDLYRAKVYMTSGKTINESEAADGMKSIGISWDAGPDDLRNGYNNLKKSIISELKQREAGYPEAAKKKLKLQGGIVAEDFSGFLKKGDTAPKRKALSEIIKPK
jgi:hypothetical protein